MKKSGELLKDYRKSRGLTLQELANLTGYSRSYLSLLESSNRPLTDDCMYKIMKHLKASKIEISRLEYVLAREAPSISFNTENLKPHQKDLLIFFLGSINKLNKEQCDEILEKIRNK